MSMNKAGGLYHDRVMNVSWPTDKSDDEHFKEQPKSFLHVSLLRIEMWTNTKPFATAKSLTLRPIRHT